MKGVKQETKVTSSRRGEDWGGGEKEGRVRDFRELDKSTNKHESVLDGLRERRLEDIHSAMLEKREPRLLAADLKASEEGEKDM
jgi:hypothetical protein